MPERPVKCIGKKVKFTPKNTTKKCLKTRFGFKENPAITGNKWINPQKREKTAPMERT
jgi:hypothetical protein